MLLNLHKKKWTDGLALQRFDAHSKTNEQTVQVIYMFVWYLNTTALLHRVPTLMIMSAEYAW